MRPTHLLHRSKVADGPRTRNLLLGRQLLSLLRYGDRKLTAGIEPASS